MYLIGLTEFNDTVAYFIGKAYGKRKIIPKVSPGKTWAGFLSGFVATIILATILGPYMTTMHYWHSFLSGIIIGLAGFFGDLTISALKRDMKIKDTGTLLPGHGGILDRIDSLLFTAPLFFYYAWYFHYS